MAKSTTTETPWQLIPTAVSGVFTICGKDTTTAVAQFVREKNAFAIINAVNDRKQLLDALVATEEYLNCWCSPSTPEGQKGVELMNRIRRLIANHIVRSISPVD